MHYTGDLSIFILKVKRGKKRFLNPVFKLELSFTSLFFFSLFESRHLNLDRQATQPPFSVAVSVSEWNEHDPSSREGTHSKGIFYRTILHTALVTGKRNLVFLFCWYWISWRTPWTSVEMLWNSLSLLCFCSHEGERREVFFKKKYLIKMPIKTDQLFGGSIYN